MTEHGFFHPARGYWQTNADVPEHIKSRYPEGTVEVPLKPGADYEWDGSEWVHTPPDPEEILAAERAAAESNRQAAYTQEADPLFFKWQAGEGTKEKWEAKREEIRARYPYPVGS